MPSLTNTAIERVAGALALVAGFFWMLWSLAASRLGERRSRDAKAGRSTAPR
jgi:hypothetical protein